jgi:EAL and modified HD-GYP domain-containing signal transduction protein
MLYIARQPIFDRNRKTQAYELLFRATEENRYTATDAELASKATMDTAVLVGLDVLSDGHDVFLNCTHDLIVDGYPSLFPPNMSVIEVLETAEPTPQLIAACEHLKSAGYRVALDDFVDHPRFAPLVELADIIKVDFRQSRPEDRKRLVRRYGKGRKMLAEKVETDAEFAEAAKSGFELFQGYFFCKPIMLATKGLPVLSDKCVRIFGILAKQELDLVEIEQIIKSEPALCYRLLRYLNSPAFYLQTEVHSILYALRLLGEQELRKWLLLVCTVSAGGARKEELVNSALIRARFAELIAPYASLPGPSLFIVSLLSLMDAILDIPLDKVLSQIAIPDEIRAAVTGEPNDLHRCHALVVAYESGDWTTCESLRRELRIHEANLRRAYLEAVQWARRLSADACSERSC